MARVYSQTQTMKPSQNKKRGGPKDTKGGASEEIKTGKKGEAEKEGEGE